MRGVPTGGTLCVQLANIAVFYVLSQAVYDNKEMMKNVQSIKRYIDDGSGLFRGTKRMFSEWISKVNSSIEPHGLYIDEYSISEPGEYINFLDIKFCFDSQGDLQTDLFVKETDARSYLYYGSSHPNHCFSGVVYLGCLRLRRIINNNDRLIKQLEILKECFISCNYPNRMVTNIANKVIKGLTRTLIKKPKSSQDSQENIRVISTFGGDSQIVEITETHSTSLSQTRSFFSLTSNPIDPQPKKNKVFQYVKKTGPSLKSRLVKAKDIALGGNGQTLPCNKPKCKLCDMICDFEEITINNFKVKPARGNCQTYNIIYMFVCTLCSKPYVGRTVNQLNIRTNQHRSAFYKVLDQCKHPNFNVDFESEDDDMYSLGLHLVNDHKLTDKNDFNNTYRVLILESVSPKNIEVKEHKWIHRVKALRPLGINNANTFSLPILILNNPAVT